MLVASLTFLIACTAFAVDISLPALPAMAEATGSTIAEAERTIGVFLLGYALGHLPMGMLSDRFGRKPIMLIGMSCFVLLGLGTALVNDINTLLLLRACQGFVAASGAVLSRAVARDITQGQATVRLLAYLASAMGMAMIAAPAVGSLALWLFGWSGPFAASALWGGIGLLLCIFFVPETRPEGATGSVWKALRTGLTAFAATRAARYGALIAAATFCGIMTLVTISPHVFMGVEALTPFQFAMTFSFISAGYVTGALITRAYAKRLSDHQLLRAVAIGFIVCLLPLGAVAALGQINASILVMSVLLGLFGSSLGLASAIALKPLGHVAGVAAGALGTIQLSSGALFSYASTYFHVETMPSLLAVFACLSCLVATLIFLYLRNVT